jgi:hypothetical protein
LSSLYTDDYGLITVPGVIVQVFRRELDSNYIAKVNLHVRVHNTTVTIYEF